MLPLSTAAISTATAAPRGPPWRAAAADPGNDLPGHEDEEEQGYDVKGRAFFAQSLFQRVFQLTLAKSDLAQC